MNETSGGPNGDGTHPCDGWGIQEYEIERLRLTERLEAKNRSFRKAIDAIKKQRKEIELLTTANDKWLENYRALDKDHTRQAAVIRGYEQLATEDGAIAAYTENRRLLIEVSRLKAIISEALSAFECTQDTNQYPIDHWASRAQGVNR